MGIRAAKDTAASVRLPLEMLERRPDPGDDVDAMAELKRTLNLRRAMQSDGGCYLLFLNFSRLVVTPGGCHHFL